VIGIIDPFKFAVSPPSAFHPTDLSVVKLFLETPIAGLVDNDPISSWLDETTNNNDGAQATSARQPTYQTDVAPIADFGADDCIVVPHNSVFNSSSHSLFGFIFPNYDGSSNYRVFLMHDDADVWMNGWGIVDSDAEDGSNNFTYYVGVYNNSSHIISVQLSMMTPYIFVCTYDGSTQKVWLNGELADSLSNSGGVPSNTNDLTIGDNDYWYPFLTNAIGFANAVFSDADREKIEGYIAHKLGAGSSNPLYSEHPYKDVAP